MLLDTLKQPLAIVLAHKGIVGGQYHLLHIPQGTAPGQGFFFKYIQHRAGQLPALQRFHQRLLIRQTGRQSPPSGA